MNEVQLEERVNNLKIRLRKESKIQTALAVFAVIVGFVLHSTFDAHVSIGIVTSALGLFTIIYVGFDKTRKRIESLLDDLSTK